MGLGGVWPLRAIPNAILYDNHRMYLSVIIPAYNEAKRIGPTLDSVGTWLAQQSFDGEIVVVDNRSTDATADVVREYRHRFPSIRLMSEKRPGKGYAVQAGMLFAGGEVRLFMDADNSTTIDHFDRCRPHLEHGYDVVIGSLAVAGANIEQGGEEPFWRVIFGKLGNLWIQFWAVPGIWDTQRGFKVFTAKATQDIFPRLKTFGWAFDVDVLAIARARGYRIKEIPVRWKNAPDSKVNVWVYPLFLLDVMRIGLRRLATVFHGNK
jgi:dolichyl-phosphate beta-glucosyltransferase